MRFIIVVAALLCGAFFFDLFVHSYDNRCKEGVSKWNCYYAFEMAELGIAANRGSRKAREMYDALSDSNPESSGYKWHVRSEYMAKRGWMATLGILFVGNMLLSLASSTKRDPESPSGDAGASEP